MLILAVNGVAVNDLAVNGALPLHIVSKSVSDTTYSVKKEKDADADGGFFGN